MDLVRIKNIEHPAFDALMKLYTEAFPREERRDIEQLKRWIVERENMNFSAITEDGELCGLLVAWDFDEFFYLEHLAVFAEMRNRKLGGKVLDYFDQTIRVPQVLEVEPICDELTERRVNYYRRNGYEVLDRNYLQPSYHDKTEEGFPMWIMVKSLAAENELSRYLDTIRREVYMP